MNDVAKKVEKVETPAAGPSLVDTVREHARRRGKDIAYRFLVDGDRNEIAITYEELDARARAVAAELQESDHRGERALLLYPPGLDFIIGFLGCLYSGVIGVPAYPPRPHRPDPRILEIVGDSRPKFALTTTSVLSAIESARMRQTELSRLSWCATDAVPLERAERGRLAAVNEKEVAYLQYTSGSTRTPKGVMVTHGSLLANLGEQSAWVVRDESGRLASADDAVFVSWLPHFHDMGLVYGILLPLSMGRPAVLMPPTAFLRNPLRWLQALTSFRGTHSAAPSFAYESCVEKVTPTQKHELDLRHWVAAFNGAEPVRIGVMERFCEAFEPCGFDPRSFCPAYGLAEATLAAAAERIGHGPQVGSFRASELERGRLAPAPEGEEVARRLVGCGSPVERNEIAIVDTETLEPSPPGHIGEIWLASASVAEGYWNRPEETETTFRAHLPGRATRFLRTGDLGGIWPPDGGELFVTGRVKDLIIIRGRNHYPQDIELTVEASHPALVKTAGAAFSIENEDEEHLVLVQEIHRHRTGEADDAIEAIRRAVVEEHELSPRAIVLIRQNQIPKTSSGKIQRRTCARAWNEGSLPVVAEWTDGAAAEAVPIAQNSTAPRTQEEIEDYVVMRLAGQMGISPEDVDLDQTFSSLGLDSARAMEFLGELEERIGRPLNPILFWNYPTISALAKYLSEAASDQGEA